MASRFASLTEQDIQKKVEHTASQSTKSSTRVAKEVFGDYESNYMPLNCIFLHV